MNERIGYIEEGIEIKIESIKIELNELFEKLENDLKTIEEEIK